MKTSYTLFSFVLTLACLMLASAASAATPKRSFDHAFNDAVFSYCGGAPYSVTHTQQTGNEAVYNVTCGHSAFDKKRVIIYCQSMPARNGGRLYVCQ